MDVQPINQQPISDDQELAKVLAGVNQQADEVAATQDADEETAQVATPEPVADVSAPAEAMPEQPTSMTPPLPPEPATPPAMPSLSGDTSELETIKKDALSELRPLVDKLNVSPEEKFDTYLLLLRSTDDKALIAPAHDAAKNIADEARRAQALLDIIKEIDYLAGPQQPAA